MLPGVWISEPLCCRSLAHPDLSKCSQDQTTKPHPKHDANSKRGWPCPTPSPLDEFPGASYSKCGPWSMTLPTGSGLPRPAGRETPAAVTWHLLHPLRSGPLPRSAAFAHQLLASSAESLDSCALTQLRSHFPTPRQGPSRSALHKPPTHRGRAGGVGEAGCGCRRHLPSLPPASTLQTWGSTKVPQAGPALAFCLSVRLLLQHCHDLLSSSQNYTEISRSTISAPSPILFTLSGLFFCRIVFSCIAIVLNHFGNEASVAFKTVVPKHQPTMLCKCRERRPRAGASTPHPWTGYLPQQPEETSRHAPPVLFTGPRSTGWAPALSHLLLPPGAPAFRMEPSARPAQGPCLLVLQL